MLETVKTANPLVHPLVARRAAEWLERAERYGVKTTIRPQEGDAYPDGVTIEFETGMASEYASLMIYPPMASGRKVRQSVAVLDHYMHRGKVRYGALKGMTLRRFTDRLHYDWSRRAKHAAKRAAGELVGA